MTAEYLAWLIEWRDDYAALLFVWIDPDGAEQPVLMSGYRFEWWRETVARVH